MVAKNSHHIGFFYHIWNTRFVYFFTKKQTSWWWHLWLMMTVFLKRDFISKQSLFCSWLFHSWCIYISEMSYASLQVWYLYHIIYNKNLLMCFILRWQHNSKLIYIIFESRREKKIIVDGKLYNYHYVWVIIVEMLMLMITQIATNGQKKVLRKNYHT